MFGKFFEACTITLGLYCCLQLSSAFSPYSNVVLFKLSQLESLSLSNFQNTLSQMNYLNGELGQNLIRE